MVTTGYKYTAYHLSTAKQWPSFDEWEEIKVLIKGSGLLKWIVLSIQTVYHVAWFESIHRQGCTGVAYIWSVDGRNLRNCNTFFAGHIHALISLDLQQTQRAALRIPDSYHAKTLKIHTPLVRFALYFHYQAVFKKFERSFFDQVAIDANTSVMPTGLVKKATFKFLKDGLVIKLSAKMLQGGLIFSGFCIITI